MGKCAITEESDIVPPTSRPPITVPPRQLAKLAVGLLFRLGLAAGRQRMLEIRSLEDDSGRDRTDHRWKVVRYDQHRRQSIVFAGWSGHMIGSE